MADPRCEGERAAVFALAARAREPVGVPALAEVLGLDAADVLGALAVLSLVGLVRAVPGPRCQVTAFGRQTYARLEEEW